MSFNNTDAQNDQVVALIVAAGFSTRFGNNDKRAAKLNRQQTLLAASYHCAASFFKNVRVIIRDDDDMSTLGLAPNTPAYRTPHARQGQGASMADGFRALLADKTLSDMQIAAVWLGDIPRITPNTLMQLSCKANANNIIRPTYAGQVGHPVFFGRRFWPELAELGGDKGAVELIKQHQAFYRKVEVDDSGICRDIDTQDDLKSFQFR
ncbi:nucleotidyltransferase family protein [Gilvimarinus sp. SDUM040013]|uniref:Nucleotidyltransferase family protein n=1 Tax=Gilvimarinus gilvus TaxID=3058038 RepID=A0ABU4RYH5_9GAMM|nr:nucleotidyltransferase family protein [Gilvimarinus sp. SDUM040013]MDO3385626.1 nucleotidyltransferase family protein [Gilvimarinus sp. SDUM040013]MDX6849960.1 nucleotidyltransferase family protein [Gilvimarinus sp. SDUM040013]